MSQACMGSLHYEGCKDCGWLIEDTGQCEINQSLYTFEEEFDYIYCKEWIDQYDADKTREQRAFYAKIHPLQSKLL